MIIETVANDERSNTMKKRVFSLMLALVLLVSAFPLTARAAGSSFGTAEAVTLGKAFSGTLSDSSQSVFYEITLPSSGRLTMNVSHDLALEMYLYNENRVQIAGDTWYENSSSGQYSRVVTRDLVSGTYYLQLKRLYNGQSGEYLIKPTFVSAKETIKETIEEQNNSYDDASAIQTNKKYLGQIAINDNCDFYQIKIDTAWKTNLAVTSDFSIYLWLYDAEQAKVWDTYCLVNGSTGLYDGTQEITLAKGTYYLLVNSYYSFQTGNYSFQFNEAPVPKVKLSSVASSGKIKVSWAAIEGAAKYEVWRSTSKSSGYKKLTTTEKLSYTDASAVAGTKYYYKARAINEEGKAGKYGSPKYRVCDLARPVVTGTHVSSTGKNKLKWKAVDGAVKYQVYRADAEAGPYKLMKTTTDLSYTNTGAEAGVKYFYKVKALHTNSSADSAYSEVKGLTCDLARPVVTASLASGKPKLSWKAVDGAVSYKVYRADTENGAYKLMKTTTALTYTDTGAVKGKTYWYKVRAISRNTDAHSAYTTPVSVKATK